MPTKKLNLSELTDQELVEKLKDDGTQYTKLKFNHTVSQIESPTRIRQMRRDIARMKTEMTSRKSKQTSPKV